MDISMRCLCSSELSLAEAPEVMACHTVSEWTSAHRQCVVNAQEFFVEDSDDRAVPEQELEGEE